MSTQAIYQEYVVFLNKAYNCINDNLANKELPEKVIITIASRGSKKNTLGWFRGSSWQAGNDLVPEINICAESLNRSYEEIFETLIHECVHLLNFKRNTPDCNAQQFHTKRFKETAELLGLTVEKMRGRGYAYTKLGTKAESVTKEFLATATKPSSNLIRVGAVKKGYAKIYAVTATQEDKEWFTQEAISKGMSQKELLAAVVETYKHKTELVEA